MTAADLYEQNAALIKATEDWAKIYRKNDETFGMLVKSEAKLERVLLQYFVDFSKRINEYIDWAEYSILLDKVNAAATDNMYVDVVVKEFEDAENDLIFSIVFQPIEMAATAGVLSAESEYKIILPDGGVSSFVNQVAKEESAYLVGKKVDKNGLIVDNPKAEYRISDVTRQKLRNSIAQSLANYEDTNQAAERIAKSIRDPKRAQRIAATESVNSYQGGQYKYAIEVGALGKEWLSLQGACPNCSDNAAAGIIAIQASFPTGHKVPSCHPYDRCGLRYVFAEEFNANSK